MSPLLMPVQKELLIKLVDAANNLPSKQPHQFFFHSLLSGVSMIDNQSLPDLSLEANRSDVVTLGIEGLILITSNGDGIFFDVTQKGVEYCKELKQQSSQPIQIIESIETKRKQRDLYLKRVYEKGCTELTPCSILEIGRELGWDYTTTDEVERFLENERLIASPAGRLVCITHEGTKYVEEILNPQEEKNSPQHVGLSTLGDLLTSPKPSAIFLFVIGTLIGSLGDALVGILLPALRPYSWLILFLWMILVFVGIWLIHRQ
ncbi:MAG: hypothetical protein ABSB41_11015 [Anaerolineales bacterium]